VHWWRFQEFTHRAAQCIPGWQIGGCHVLIQKAWLWTIMVNMFGMHHAKDLFCRFQIWVRALQPLQKTQFFVHAQRSIICQWQSKVFDQVLLFLIIEYSRPEYSWNTASWMKNNKQSINRHDIAEILLKVALNTIKQTIINQVINQFNVKWRHTVRSKNAYHYKRQHIYGMDGFMRN
jgi:hypothetical protein